MADLFQGTALPAITETTEKATAAPEFYTNYLQDIANLGQGAVSAGGIAGFSPLQQQAFQMAPQMAFSGAQTMGSAANLAGQVGTTKMPDVVANYMNPYTKGVVDEMGRLTQRNVLENVLPNIAAGSIGTGQFGSRRQSQITGQTLRDIQADLLGKQLGALQSGYTEAGRFAQSDLDRQLNAAQNLQSIGSAQQTMGTTGLDVLSKLGGQQQELGQKQLDYPMAMAKAYSELMRGYTIPTAEVTQTTGPKAGAYGTSPLAQIASLLLGLGSFMKDGGSVRGYKKGGSARPARAQYHDGKGNFYDSNGYLVR
jgi:hypothetical protein